MWKNLHVFYCQFIDNQVRIGELTIYKDKKLGSGMFGYVFKGTMHGKPCAVKVLHEVAMELKFDLPTVSDDKPVQEAKLNCLEKEHKSLLELKHPNVVELLHVCTYRQSNLPCLVMELLDCSLREYLAQTSEYLQFETQISLSCDIAKALAYLHEMMMIHRDLCGDNILIQLGNAIPTAKIADFGMSRIIDPEKMTHSVSVLGHRKGYLPPEGPYKDYDLSLDIHMFGAIMVQIVHAVQDIKSPEIRRELIDRISENHPLKKIIKSCVVVAKDDRPTAESISAELQNLLLDITNYTYTH